MNGHIYQPHEDQFICDNHKTMTDQQIADCLHRPYKSITNRRLKLGCVMVTAPKPWTDAEDKFLRDNRHMTRKELADVLGRSVNAVADHRCKLGLTKSRNPEPPRAVLDWTKWRPSVMPVQFDDGLKQAVKLQSMLMALGVR